MALSSKGVYIVGAKRTPFCSYGGHFKEWQAGHAFAAAAKDAISSANVDPSFVDQTVVGNVNFLSQCDGGKTPRYCGIYSGVPIEKPALGINKAGGSGLQAIITSAVDLLTGPSLCLTGGTEIMTALPLLVRNVRFGTTLGRSYHVEDHMKSFPESYTGLTIQKLAEETAKRNNVGRKEVDEYTADSVLRWKNAQKSDVFSNEITKVTINIKEKDFVVAEDQPVQVDVTAKELGELPALDGQIITMGNSSSPADGAAALVLASEEAVKRHDLQPLVKISGWACVGTDPNDSAAGTVAAVQKLLHSHKLSVDDVDLYEIDETFASQVLAVSKQLKVDLSKVNVNGGALALGHPVAATGARMATHLTYELGRRNVKRGIAALNCGLGQGIAVMLERL